VPVLEPVIMNDRRFSVPTVPEAVERIRAREPQLSAFVSTRLDEALGEHAARMAEAARSDLHGLPYALKDSWDVAGMATSGGSWRFRDRVPSVSSPVYEAFDAAGGVLVGKTNLSDLALAPEAASFVGGVTANPRDLSRTAGGSSGGAAAAVADRMIAFDWGSDIGGSIRLPAAYCGIYGLRLSSATWPLHGDFPSPPESLKWMNGQGPLASDLGVMRAVLRAAAPRLRSGAERPFALRGVTMWIPDGSARARWPSFESDVRGALGRAFERVERNDRLGSMQRAYRATLAMWSSHFEDLLACDPISLGEGIGAVLSSVVLRGSLGDRRFHPVTAQILLLIAIGRVTIFRDRKRASAAAEAFRAAMQREWDEGWVVAAPTATHPAPRHGRSILDQHTLVCTMPGNLCDATGLAIPWGTFDDGMPRSMQLLGPPGSEQVLLDAAERLAHRDR
jgi:Asp-tRNA(Asn)/Glu-tRNA(Gln) amidotransferase A subunit family amidase